MKKFHNKSFKGLCLIAVFAITLYGCEKEKTAAVTPPDEVLANTKVVTTLGDQVKLCNGKAQSFVCKDEQGNPVSIGFIFSEEVLNHLPDKMTMTPIPVPKNSGTLVDHISVDFEPMGHEPVGIYDKPHFDIHFYMITKSQQMMIETGPKMEKLPAAEFIPPSYQPSPGGVPMMGKHFSDVTSKEFNGQPFDRTFVYGSYDGKFIFHEPMITIAYFKSKKSFNDDIKQHPKVQRDGYYPKNYSVTYNASNKMYTVMLSNLTLRKT
jgi:hypothetical protein